MTTDLAARLRARESVLGYWCVLDAAVATERIARVGFDYICFDMQHGLIDYSGLVSGLMAVDAAGEAAGVVRVGANDAAAIGRALDAGARAVIVPLIDSAADAARAVAATQYAPRGIRSYGPMRSGLRVGPVPVEADAQVAVLAMIETASGLAALEEICATPGLAGVYVGPSDLSLALGGSRPGDPAITAAFDDALARVVETAHRTGIAAGIHTPDGDNARRRLAQGFTFASIASDLVHLEATAAAHLAAARS